MREQHHQGALPHPLGLPAADELVDDALSGVGEVSELRLPYHKRVRTSERVSELEAEHGVLGQGAVVDDVLGLVGRQVVQRDRDHLVAHLVVKHMVPVTATRINVNINGKLRDCDGHFHDLSVCLVCTIIPLLEGFVYTELNKRKHQREIARFTATSMILHHLDFQYVSSDIWDFGPTIL